MTNSIPASALVNVLPGVLTAGGVPLALNAVMLSQDPSIPIGTVLQFPTALAVSNWFGPNAPETALANIYFQGYNGASQTPGNLIFAQYNTAAVAGYLRGASVAGLTLAQLTALSGTLTLTVNGETETTASINLSGATSFSNAATIIQAAVTAGTTFSGTGSITTTTLTISAVASGALKVGDTIAGTGVTGATTITAFLTGTGGTGTYTVSTSQTVASTTITVGGTGVVGYDAQRQAFTITSPTTGASSTVAFAGGTLAPLLYLTAATGAVTSAGAAAATPTSVMNQVVAATQNWATFMTVTEVVDATKLLFAAWNTAQGKRYVYVMQDSNATIGSGAAPTSVGVQTKTYNGIVPVSDTTGGQLAAFICGTIASINFAATNGRITLAYKGLAALVPQVTDPTVAANMTANGYNFYAQYATAAQNFQMLQTGLISGGYNFIDIYVNQIYLNSQLQLALMSLLTSVTSIPYNQAGYNLLRAAMLGPIQAALNFGTMRQGVALSSSQAAQVNAAAGAKVDQSITAAGYYLQVLAPSAQVRVARGTPIINLFYEDGEAVQTISLTSTDIL